MPRMVPEECAPELQWIAPGRVREFVEKGLRRIRRARAADGAPPAQGHTHLRRMELDRKIWDAVRKRGGALNRRGVDAVLHERRLARPTHAARLPSDAH